MKSMMSPYWRGCGDPCAQCSILEGTRGPCSQEDGFWGLVTIVMTTCALRDIHAVLLSRSHHHFTSRLTVDEAFVHVLVQVLNALDRRTNLNVAFILNPKVGRVTYDLIV